MMSLESSQNKEGPFAAMTRSDSGNKDKDHYQVRGYIGKYNGQKVLRTWMVIPTVSKSLDRFSCRLFTSQNPKHVKAFKQDE